MSWSGRAKPADKDVTVEFNAGSDREFAVKLAGDILIFILIPMSSPRKNPIYIMKEEYILQNEINRYFGQVLVYILWLNRSGTTGATIEATYWQG